VLESIKPRVVGTPLEPLARKVYRAFHRKSSIGDLNKLYDSQAEAIMQRVLSRRSNGVDVGCHEGEILDAMRRHAPDGEFYAFEPLPHLFSALQTKYASDGNVHLVQAALSESAGNSSFQHVVTNPGYSGLRPRAYSRPDETIVEIQVVMSRLDDILPTDFDVHFMKIDVEGAELQVLRGSVATLQRCRPYVVFEHGMGGTDWYGTRPEQVYDLFADAGLRVSTMENWLSSTKPPGFSRAEFVDQFDRGVNFYFLAHP
jgi:FkbM family methyltransferase